MLRRAENIMNIEDFIRFHFFIFLGSWMSFKRLLDFCFIAFWSLGLTFSDFRRSWE